MPPDSGRQAPGRYCPLHYRYAPEVFSRAPDIDAGILYVIGGLYGNPQALDAILALAAAESGPVKLVFNGDFNWFNIDAAGFENINARVLRHHALRGNVETELANDDPAAGCGCAYPESVGDAEVARSNLIEDSLRATARANPQLRSRLAALPMHAVAKVGKLRVAIVHGDAEALAGWGFSLSSLDNPARQAWIERCFGRANVRVFASSHTCLPVCREIESSAGTCAVVNNGAAGMPNFAETHFGIVTRIAVTPSANALYGIELDGVHIEALRVDYDQAAWLAAFLKNWPPGSPAHASYWQRLVQGTDMDLEAAAPHTSPRRPAARLAGACHD